MNAIQDIILLLFVLRYRDHTAHRPPPRRGYKRDLSESSTNYNPFVARYRR